MAITLGMSNWTTGQQPTLAQAFGFKNTQLTVPHLTAQLNSSNSGSSNQQNQNNPNNPPGNPNAPSGGDPKANAQLGQQMAAAHPYNWTGAEWTALNNIVMAESGWDTTATNKSSGAYGIPQALPAQKMASAGSNWKNDPATQIKWMLLYIQQRYGDPVNAWQFHQRNGWY